MKKILFIVSTLVVFGSCIKNEDFECDYDTCRFTAPASEVQSVETYLSSNNITATKHCSGVYYTIDTLGTGKYAEPCSSVSVTYVGRRTNGNIFDQSNGIATFDLSRLITGWRNTLPLIKEGGTITLYIPPSLGYGSQDIKDANGNVVLPANSILIFQIGLKRVN